VLEHPSVNWVVSITTAIVPVSLRAVAKLLWNFMVQLARPFRQREWTMWFVSIAME